MNSDKKSKLAIGRTSLVVSIVVVAIILAGVAAASSIKPSTMSTQTVATSQSFLTSFSSSESVTAQSSFSSSITGPCAFSVPFQAISIAEQLSFSECLASESSGAVHFVITNGNGLTLGGSVISQYPVGVVITIFPVSDYYANYYVGQLMFTQSNTVAASFNGLSLLPATRYEIAVTNLANQDNSVTINMQLS